MTRASISSLDSASAIVESFGFVTANPAKSMGKVGSIGLPISSTDVLIVDTAGRLHNKKHLMEELEKISRVVDREWPQAARETLLVLDGTTGQNALMQARAFSQEVPVTGLVLTKLDGTAKGGAVIPILREMPVPIRFIGVGEGIDDLQDFDAGQFAKAIL